MTELDPTGQLSPAAIGALQDAKSAFLGAQAERCGYLSVAIEPHPEQGEVAVAARFTLRPRREWHRADASIPLAELEGSDPAPSIARAFRSLSDSVATIGIAHLFRPLGDAARL
jgi:hypothetical protein